MTDVVSAHRGASSLARATTARARERGLDEGCRRVVFIVAARRARALAAGAEGARARDIERSIARERPERRRARVRARVRMRARGDDGMIGSDRRVVTSARARSRREMSHGTFTDAAPLFSSDAREEMTTARVDASQTRDISLDTLDETVWATVRRDAALVRRNCAAVLMPTNWGANGATRLREWDLWGPLVFVLTLSATLSAGVPDGHETFSVVFATVGIGAVALTANVLLLGGRIIFLQSVALLGYCVVPLCLASALCLASENKIFRLVVTAAAVTWSGKASVPFVSAAVPNARRALAVYPVLLMYVFLGWLAVARSGTPSAGAPPAAASPPPPFAPPPFPPPGSPPGPA